MRTDRSLQAHFATREQQAEAAQLGMWVFLTTEVLLFAPLFVTYFYFRLSFHTEFHEAGAHVDALLGTLMTLTLVTSSLFAALAVGAARHGRARAVAPLILVAALLGVAFLVMHGAEYAEHARAGILPGRWYAFDEVPEQGGNLFFTLYYLTTGLHMFHVAVGVSIFAVLAWRAFRGSYSAAYHTPIELGALYWHLVDMLWLFIYPMYYLVR